MDLPADYVTPALKRLAPVLTAIFAAYGVPRARQEEILREAGRMVTLKWHRLQQPDTVLLRWIVERCRTGEETENEEASD
jgi:ribosomal protein S13